MGRTLQRVLVAFAAIVAIPMVTLGGYDAFVVQPRLDALRTLLRQADPQDANPPAIVRRLIDTNSDAIDVQGSRLAVFAVHPSRSPGEWQARWMLWRVLLPMHFTRDERLAFFASRSWNGVDLGMNAHALRTYGKPLDALSDDEAAHVVASLGSPGYYKRHPRLLEQRAKEILARASLR